VRFTASQYDQAIAALRDAREQLVPDGYCCRICNDTGHQAWECGHNPLLAMATCEGIARSAMALHDRLHTIEDAMHNSPQDEEIAEWREDTHDLLHHLAGHDIRMGTQVGPASVSLPEEASNGA
jgi:hypothetical protein